MRHSHSLPRTLLALGGAIIWGLIEFTALARARLAQRIGRD